MEVAKGVVKHILVVKFKVETPQDRIDQLIKEFANLVDLIEPMKDFIWGKDVSTANLHQGLTHVFQATFDNMEDVETYMAHPAHLAFANQLLPASETIILMDYKPTTVNLKMDI